MRFKWDDNAPYEFLMKFGVRHEDRMKDCIGAIRRLKFKDVKVEDIELHDPMYKVFINRLQHHAKKLKDGSKIGTLFCRKLENGKWMPKDGNHRLYILIAHGIKVFRIAYDPENEV